MKFGIIGHGFVGRATAKVWMEHGDVLIHDKMSSRSANTLEEVADCDFIFVCVPTPPTKDWKCDLSILDAVLKDLQRIGTSRTVVIKSTVPIGTTYDSHIGTGLNLLHSPEFLTARCALIDAQTPSRNIVGQAVATGESSRAAVRLAELYEKRFPGVPCFLMSSDESEAVKLITNSFFAIKVAAFNEFRETCEKSDLDWGKVREGVLADGRIAHAHTTTPGPDGKAGFGGTCLPKDLAFLSEKSHEVGAGNVMTGAAFARNIVDRSANYSSWNIGPPFNED